MKACAVCGKTEGLKQCSRCKEVLYCSVEHQQSHWPFHKDQCATLKDGKDLFKIGQREDGVRALREVVRKNASMENELELANMLGMLGQQLMIQQPPDLDQAATVLSEAIQLNGRWSRLLQGRSALQGHYRASLGECFYKQYKLVLAAKEFTEAISLLRADRTSDVSVLMFAEIQLALVNYDMGKVENSISELRRVLALWPDDLGIVGRLAQFLFDGQGKAAEALGVLDAALKSGPPSFSSQDKISNYCYAAVEAGVCAASMDNDIQAEKYFSLLDHERISLESLPRFHSKRCEWVVCRTIVASRLENKETVAKMKEHMDLLAFQGAACVVSSWNFICSTARALVLDSSFCFSQFLMLKLGVAAASMEGLVLEFGVYHGKSIRTIAYGFPLYQVHGFDSFEGLPEEWSSTTLAGSYSVHGHLPRDLPKNVQLHVGLFKDTLPGFLESHPGPIRFMNIDCDIYSSTKDIFDLTWPRIVPGTVIVFDEYLMYPRWERHEFRAFQEAVTSHGWSFEYLGISVISRQAVIRITTPSRTIEDGLKAGKRSGLRLEPCSMNVLEL